jgi:hypothetical protein
MIASPHYLESGQVRENISKACSDGLFAVASRDAATGSRYASPAA